MSAAYLELGWDSQTIETLSLRVTPAPEKISARPFPAPARPVRCPECRSVIYSRRHRLCGVCNQPLPDHLLFTVMEARRVEGLLEAERNRHRQWMDQRRFE